MIPYGDVLTVERVRPLGQGVEVRADRTAKPNTDSPVKETGRNAQPRSDAQKNGDAVTISENGNIDLTMFNYIDKGGDASRALSANETDDAAFQPKPNFAGMSLSRYEAMKAEIERNFANDSAAKDRYLRELDKALSDYVLLQAKITEALSSGKADSNDAAADGSGRADASEANSEEIARLKQLYQVGSREVKAILEKVLGNMETSNSKEADRFVDDFFVDIYKQRMDSPDRTNAFGQEVNSATRKIWESVRLNIDS